MSYQSEIQTASDLISAQGAPWDGINAEYVARMRLQNRFKTGLDIAKYTAKIMREDMESMVPVRLKDVDGAQMAMVQVAKDLAARGDIMLAGQGADDELIY